MTERDPIVAVALARRPVPDHAPGFWPELEARLAATATDVGLDEDAQTTVISLTVAPSRRRRWLVLAAGVVAAAAVATAALVVVGDGGDDDTVVISDPTTVTTLSTTTPAAVTTSPAPTPATPVPAPAGDLEAFRGVWPFASYAGVADYLTSGSSEYADPRLVVERFATDLIGVVDPVVTLATSTEDGLDVVVELRTRTEAGAVNINLPPTIVTARRVGDDTATDPDGPWVVTGATSEDLTIESPTVNAAVTSPLNVSGQGEGYEGTVSASLYSGTTPIAGPAATIAGSQGTPGPYSIPLTFDLPAAGTPLMLIARTDSGADFVGVPAFAVTRVVAASGEIRPDPAGVVAAFLHAVSARETEVAWDLLDPAAQQASAGRQAFETYMASAFGQDLAGLAELPGDSYSVRRWAPTSENEPDVSVVTVASDPNAGVPVAQAFAVSAEGRIVSTFVETRDPSVDAVGWVGATGAGPLEVLIPTSAIAPTISMDDHGVPVSASDVTGGAEPQSAVSFSTGNLAAGPRVVTLSFLRPDGLVHAEARVVDFVDRSQTAAHAVRLFLDALSAGDGDAAWALLHPTAQEAMGGRQAFDDLMQGGLSEGLGAFAALPDEAYSTPFFTAPSPIPMTEEVVAVVGEVTREGTTEFDAYGFATMWEPEGWLLRATFDTAILDNTAWPDGAVGGNDPSIAILPVTVPAGATAIALDIDSAQTLRPLSQQGDAVEFGIPMEVMSGRHVFTLTFQQANGLVHAESEVYNLGPG